VGIAVPEATGKILSRPSPAANKAQAEAGTQLRNRCLHHTSLASCLCVVVSVKKTGLQSQETGGF